MRRLLLTENITADGRIEMLDEWFNPSPDGDIQDWLDEMERLGASSDAVLLGRQTFEDFRGYWPEHTDELLSDASDDDEAVAVAEDVER
jgi:dihydrofolate reductase